MPTYKPELTSREQGKYLSIARELQAAGARVDIPDEWQENARFLRVTIAGSPESLITQLSPSIVLYAFRVRLLAEHGGRLQEFEVATCWDPGISPSYAEGRTPYRFAPGLDFSVKEVLNDRIESGLRFRRGDVQEGWLLAMGNQPVPQEYGPGRPAPVEVRFFDQFSQSQVASASALVQRSTRTRKSSLRPGLGLYEREDPPVSMQRGVTSGAIVPLGPLPHVNTARREKACIPEPSLPRVIQNA
jgi:hypothetical protein